VLVVLFLIGFAFLARFIPPPNPKSAPEVIAAMYRDNANGIRLGMVFTLFGITLYLPFAAVITRQIQRIHGPTSTLGLVQFGLGAVFPVAFFPAFYYFAVAAYRPERSAESIQTLNDMGWIPFTGIIYTAFLQLLVIGIAVLSDSRDEPILPRMYGYFCIWCALVYAPGCIDVFFQGGPFAWNGLFSFWLPTVAFLAWLVTTTIVIFRAITAQEQSDASKDLPMQGSPEQLAIAKREMPGQSSVELRLEALDAEVAALRKGLSLKANPY
jgi:hypothetical protein